MGNKATRQTSSKRALLASVLSLVICAAMLVGTTFAWFTDSVTSGRNTIVAGNLDVELEYATVDDTGALNDWKSVDGATDLFADGLWEPGYAQVVYLRVSNLGTLALKYQFSLNITSETPGTNVSGEQFLLSDYLQYGVVNGRDTAFATRADAIAAVQNPAPLDTYTKAGNLEAGANPEYVALVVYMPETVGNEANYRGNAIPTIALGLNLTATQDTVESDSFDNTYDENADDALLFDGGTTTINQNVTVLNADGTAVTATGDGTVVNITGGRYDGGAGGNNACVWACPGATVNISDGTFTVGADASGAGNSVIYSTGGTVNISGGFFYTDYSWNNRYYVLNLQNGSGGTIRVTGGTFVNMDPSAGDDVDGGTFVADGYTVVSEVRPDGDIWYTVVKAAQTSDELTTALGDAEPGDTVALIGNVTLSAPLTINKDITIDGLGSAAFRGKPVTVTADVTFKNLTLDKPTNSNNNATLVYAHDGCDSLTFDGCTFSDPQWEAIQITSSSFKRLTVNNCTFTAADVEGAPSNYGNTANQAIRFIHIEPDAAKRVVADITITNNVFKNCDHVVDSVVGIYYVDGSTITVGGNSFEQLGDVGGVSKKLSVGWPEEEELKVVSNWTGAEKTFTING